MCFVLCVEEEREKLRVQVVEAMSEEEIQKRAQEILKQAALQGLDTEKEREKENKDAAAMETEGKENDEEKKEATEGKDWECEDKKKPDENAEEADDNKKRGENVETGEKLNDGAGSKPKVSSVLKERELNKKVAEISTDEKKKEGEETEGDTEETEPEGDSRICWPVWAVIVLAHFETTCLPWKLKNLNWFCSPLPLLLLVCRIKNKRNLFQFHNMHELYFVFASLDKNTTSTTFSCFQPHSDL